MKESIKRLLPTAVLLAILFALLLFYSIKEPLKKEGKQVALTKFQMVACIAASEGGSCNTKLKDIGIITSERCCENYGKCC